MNYCVRPLGRIDCPAKRWDDQKKHQKFSTRHGLSSQFWHMLFSCENICKVVLGTLMFGGSSSPCPSQTVAWTRKGIVCVCVAPPTITAEWHVFLRAAHHAQYFCIQCGGIPMWWHWKYLTTEVQKQYTANHCNQCHLMRKRSKHFQILPKKNIVCFNENTTRCLFCWPGLRFFFENWNLVRAGKLHCVFLMVAMPFTIWHGMKHGIPKCTCVVQNNILDMVGTKILKTKKNTWRSGKSNGIAVVCFCTTFLEPRHHVEDPYWPVLRSAGRLSFSFVFFHNATMYFQKNKPQQIPSLRQCGWIF